MEEVWRDITGWEGKYQVSNLGRVKSVKCTIMRGNGRPYPQPETLRKFRISHWGYLKVKLYDTKNKIHKEVFVHRLVADAFLPPIEGKKQINHIDGNKHNNRLENLERCTNSENQIHAWKHGLNHYQGKLDKAIVQMTKDGEEIRIWKSLHEAERNVPGATIGHIWGCLVGQRHTCAGYKWKYYELD